MSERRGFLERHKWGWGVGAKEKPTKQNPHPYCGPYAHVDYDEAWLNIITDDYEGHAMLNIEALPYLRRALAEIAREIRVKQKSNSAGRREDDPT